MRRIRKIKTLVFMTLVTSMFLTATANANLPVKQLVNLDYKEKTITFLEGNHEFIFLTSDTGYNDLTINITYSNLTGWSLIEVKSNPVNITWRFTNNSKNYYYVDNITNTIYTITVDYSMVEVPPNPDNHTVTMLREKIDTLEEVNQSYNSMLENYTFMKEEYSHYNETVTGLQHNITLLKERIKTLEAERDRYKDNYQNIKTDYDNLNENYMKLSDKYGKLKAKWDDLFSRLILPAIIAFLAGVIVVRGYEIANKNRVFRPKKPYKPEKTKHYIEPEQFTKFKERLEKANLGQSYVEGAKEPHWKKIDETENHIKYTYGKTVLEFKRKTDNQDIWDVFIDNQYYKSVIMPDENLKKQTIENFQKAVEKALKE